MAVELADCTRPVSFVVGSTFAFFGLVTLFGGGAAVAKFIAAPARLVPSGGFAGHGGGCEAGLSGQRGWACGGAHLRVLAS